MRSALLQSLGPRIGSEKTLDVFWGSGFLASTIVDRVRNRIRMPAGVRLLSLVLLVLVSLASLRTAGAGCVNGSAVGAAIGGDSCCRSGAAACCPSHCCVQSPEDASASRPLQAVLPGGGPSYLSPAVLLRVLRLLPKAPDAPVLGRVTAQFGDLPPGLPLFLRQAALLI